MQQATGNANFAQTHTTQNCLFSIRTGKGFTHLEATLPQILA